MGAPRSNRGSSGDAFICVVDNDRPVRFAVKNLPEYTGYTRFLSTRARPAWRRRSAPSSPSRYPISNGKHERIRLATAVGGGRHALAAGVGRRLRRPCVGAVRHSRPRHRLSAQAHRCRPRARAHRESALGGRQAPPSRQVPTAGAALARLAWLERQHAAVLDLFAAQGAHGETAPAARSGHSNFLTIPGKFFGSAARLLDSHC